jgi:hypothetical protein
MLALVVLYCFFVFIFLTNGTMPKENGTVPISCISLIKEHGTNLISLIKENGTNGKEKVVY